MAAKPNVLMRTVARFNRRSELEVEFKAVPEPRPRFLLLNQIRVLSLTGKAGRP